MVFQSIKYFLIHSLFDIHSLFLQGYGDGHTPAHNETLPCHMWHFKSKQTNRCHLSNGWFLSCQQFKRTKSNETQRTIIFSASSSSSHVWISMNHVWQACCSIGHNRNQHGPIWQMDFLEHFLEMCQNVFLGHRFINRCFHCHLKNTNMKSNCPSRTGRLVYSAVYCGNRLRIHIWDRSCQNDCCSSHVDSGRFASGKNRGCHPKLNLPPVSTSL